MIAEQLTVTELNRLVADFRQYKETGIPAHYFGRDVPYDHPHTLPSVRVEHVMHLHLAESESSWNARQSQYHRTSDYHLVYCQGFYKSEHFLLMSILHPEAHLQACDNTIMSKLAIMAAKFREKF